MANEKQVESNDGGADVFDIERVRQLVSLMKEQELTEIDLRQGQKRIRLRSGQETAYVAAPMAHAAPAAAPPSAAAASAADTSSSDDAEASYIKSPMVGTFYLAGKPGDPPFVKVGDHVTPETTVCIIEAMKMFNEIPAGVSGKIVEVVAKNEDAVDVGRPLFKIV